MYKRFSVVGQSPSLRGLVGVAVAESYPRARRKTIYETCVEDHNFPAERPFSPEQVPNEDFVPE